MRNELSTLQKSESQLKAKNKQQAAILESIKMLKEKKELKQENNEQSIYQLTVQLGSLTEENNELKSNLKEQKEQYEERLQDAKDRAREEYLELQTDLDLIRAELENSEKESKIALDELKIEFAEKDKKIKSLKEEIKQGVKDCDDLNVLC